MRLLISVFLGFQSSPDPKAGRYDLAQVAVASQLPVPILTRPEGRALLPGG